MFTLFTDINALRLNTRWVAIRFSRVNVWQACGKRLLAFLAGLGRSVVRAPAELASLVKADRAALVFFSSTRNQTVSLAPIAAPLSGARWALVNQGSGGVSTPLPFPSIIVSAVSILTLPLTLALVLLFVMQRTRPEETVAERARAAALSIDELLRTFGYWTAAWLFMRAHHVRVLVMSNDHNSINRAFCLAGNRLGADTVYVQHAPVSDLFPRLIFSRAFLDGRFAADIYAAKPSGTIVDVLGAPRYDGSFLRPAATTTDIKSISLCVNKLDCHARFNAYCTAFRQRGWTVVVRPHPGMTDSDLSFLPQGLDIDRSDIAEHLRKVRFLVAGSSGVLLDAYMAGVVPLLATDLSRVADYYGFVAKGAVFPIDLESVDRFDRMFATYSLEALKDGMTQFNAAIGTDYAYAVPQKVGEKIKSCLEAMDRKGICPQ